MDLTVILGTQPVADAEEEAFVVFSQDIPSQSLGFIDSQASTLEITVAGHDLTIHQSRGLLTSDRKEGTTGAVVWKVTPLFAQWISNPSNFLFANGLLSSTSTVLELGAGVSGIVALALGPLVASYTATDQSYVLKLLRQNIASNLAAVLPRPKTKSKTKGKPPTPESTITAHELDWETSDPSHLPAPDVVIACDCIYNESLIEPLNGMCEALCRLRPSSADCNGNGNGNGEGEGEGRPTLCIVAQQLRSPDVFEAWLKSFCEKFVVWQVPDGLVYRGLGEGSGFVVHVGLLRE